MMQAAKEITFGRFRLDLGNECLWQSGKAISLRPKAFAVLKLLVENPGLLVTKQRVLETVWPGTFVGDAVLKDSIRQLREALKDDATAPTYIETAHRRGYRFIGKLSSAGPEALDVGAIPEPSASDSLAGTQSVRLTGALGREIELEKLRGCLNQARGGERQVVFITGEPGIGKTTVVNAFLDTVSNLAEVLVARGQCLEHYGAAEAYLPVLDGFSRLCRSPQGAHVIEVLRRQAPAWLAQMPGLAPSADQQNPNAQTGIPTRERMLREMAEAIEALASASPLLLILEDLHWSDYSTLDLLSYVSRRRDPARLMVIGTYRPVDVVLGGHPLKGVKRELQAHNLCHELPLEYLTEASLAEYLAARFRGHQFPARLRRAIYRRTEGNPLFMVNLVNYLAAQKMIVEENHIWKLRVEASAIEHEVPANLRQLIEKQMERLSLDERTVLEAASIAGMECSSVAIAAGLDVSLEWVEQQCEELARRHQFLSPAWLVELPDGTMTPRRRFIHVLYLEVAYGLMSPARRSQIHQRIAERGIAIYGSRSSEIAAELAMHFEQSRDWPRAVAFLLQAAQNATARSAHHEAIELAKRGLETVKLLSENADAAKSEMKLRMILSVSLMATKGFAAPEVEKINAPGRELFWRQGASPELFYMLWSQNFYQQFSGEMRSALEISYQLMQLAEDLKDGALTMEAHQSIGALLVLLGRPSEALDHIEKGSVLYAAHHNHHYSVFGSFDSKVMFECFAALALLDLGCPDRSAERLETGLALARELGHSQTLVTALHVAAQLHQMRGEAFLAGECAKEALELADENGFAVWRAYGLIELGWAVAELGDPQDGIEKMQKGLAEYEATGAKLRSPYFLALFADQLGKAGRTEEGLFAITKALSIAEQTGEAFALAELYRTKGELLLKGVRLAPTRQLANDSPGASQARQCFAKALAIAKKQGTKFWQLKAAMSMDRYSIELSPVGGRLPSKSS
jgi:DNA-binding winged helix-turn-helix (wHTH) protein/predicted ATPase